MQKHPARSPGSETSPKLLSELGTVLNGFALQDAFVFT